MTQDNHGQEGRRIPLAVAALCGAIVAAAAFSMIASGDEAQVSATGKDATFQPAPRVESGTLEAVPVPGCGVRKHGRAGVLCAAPAPCPSEGGRADAGSASVCGEVNPVDCGNSARRAGRSDVACVIPASPGQAELGGHGCERATLKPLGHGGAHPEPGPLKPYPGRPRK